ncbi:hypothetical protein G6M89_21985 [Natronolimnobius sp. AArcel1]|uniref:hypothetical protein n=1 Tax=Natronolimnobius sp. AArcel1 TaxID=1679093 RepID=UPI0013EB53FA|nr:hypothetical protein [Natronolimnobius sp. AArcel1]NGM71618.1 hypothetical protein [Natronolimnobius sp. AArcel1]
MDTRPITDLFDARSSAIEPHEVLRDYHYRRIDRIDDEGFEINGDDKGIILTHIATVDALGPYLEDQVDVAEFVDSSTKFPVLKRSPYSNVSDHLNLCSRGAKATKSTKSDQFACTWIDRTGVVEAISTDLVYEQRDKLTIQTEVLERSMTQLVTSYFEKVAEPNDDIILATVTYLGFDGVYTPRIGDFGRHHEIKTSFIETPVVSVTEENTRKQITPLLRPLWQEVGYSESPYMTEDGWKFKDND